MSDRPDYETYRSQVMGRIDLNDMISPTFDEMRYCLFICAGQIEQRIKDGYTAGEDAFAVADDIFVSRLEMQPDPGVLSDEMEG